MTLRRTSTTGFPDRCKSPPGLLIIEILDMGRRSCLSGAQPSSAGAPGWLPGQSMSARRCRTLTNAAKNSGVHQRPFQTFSVRSSVRTPRRAASVRRTQAPVARSAPEASAHYSLSLLQTLLTARVGIKIDFEIPRIGAWPPIADQEHGRRAWRRRRQRALSTNVRGSPLGPG